MAPLPAPGTTIRSETDLRELWQQLLGSADFCRHTVWLILLDERGQVQPLLLPIDDVPSAPDPKILRSLSRVLDGMVDGRVADSVALLMSRPGTAELTENDWSWVRGLARVLRPEISPWPLHLATHDGISCLPSGDPSNEPTD